MPTQVPIQLHRNGRPIEIVEPGQGSKHDTHDGDLWHAILLGPAAEDLGLAIPSVTVHKMEMLLANGKVQDFYIRYNQTETPGCKQCDMLSTGSIPGTGKELPPGVRM